MGKDLVVAEPRNIRVWSPGTLSGEDAPSVSNSPVHADLVLKVHHKRIPLIAKTRTYFCMIKIPKTDSRYDRFLRDQCSVEIPEVIKRCHAHQLETALC